VLGIFVSNSPTPLIFAHFFPFSLLLLLLVSLSSLSFEVERVRVGRTGLILIPVRCQCKGCVLPTKLCGDDVQSQ